MILDLLKKRCSIRSFKEQEIETEKVDRILEAGRLSPSGGNEQPWIFGVIREKGLIEEISGIAYKQGWIATSSLLFVLCTTIIEDKRGAREIQKRRFPKRRDEIDKMDKVLYSYLNSEEHQTKIAGTHMALQALELGIYSTWVSYFEAEKLAELLNFPKLIVPSEILVFGYPEEEPMPRLKKELKEIVFYNHYAP